jgi:proteasome lid subunit RPN8/RPN11
MLRIAKPDYDIIRWEAERNYPEECCGILLGNQEGKERVVTMVLPCENARTDSPGNSFSIHPEKLFSVLRLARNRGESIVGFYHSHPDHPARCSNTDLEEAHWFDCSYVITSVEAGHAAATSSFVLIGSEQKKEFHAERVEVVAYRHPLPVAL